MEKQMSFVAAIALLLEVAETFADDAPNEDNIWSAVELVREQMNLTPDRERELVRDFTA